MTIIEEPKGPYQGLPQRARQRRGRREDFAHLNREDNTIHHDDTIEDMNSASCVARSIERRKLVTLMEKEFRDSPARFREYELPPVPETLLCSVHYPIPADSVPGTVRLDNF